MKKELTVIGIIPQYPKHSQNNIYAKIKMPPVGILSVISQINDIPSAKKFTRLMKTITTGRRISSAGRIIPFCRPDNPRNWRYSTAA